MNNTETNTIKQAIEIIELIEVHHRLNLGIDGPLLNMAEEWLEKNETFINNIYKK